MKGAAERCYREWLVSDPVTRLRLRPTVDAATARWPRTERRSPGNSGESKVRSRCQPEVDSGSNSFQAPCHIPTGWGL